MPNLYKFSGYYVNPFNSRDMAPDLLNNIRCVERLGIVPYHVHMEKSEDMDHVKFFEPNCDLAELEKFFLPKANGFKFDRPVPKPHQIWRHFKGKEVRIICLARHSENPAHTLVVYTCENGEYARPLDMFMSEVDHEKYPDAEQKYRFEPMGDWV